MRYSDLKIKRCKLCSVKKLLYTGSWAFLPFRVRFSIGFTLQSNALIRFAWLYVCHPLRSHQGINWEFKLFFDTLSCFQILSDNLKFAKVKGNMAIKLDESCNIYQPAMIYWWGNSSFQTWNGPLHQPALIQCIKWVSELPESLTFSSKMTHSSPVWKRVKESYSGDKNKNTLHFMSVKGLLPESSIL